ncbi:MAG: hypothetical protein KY475_23995 [Planctomycetes bacterium]|nr:hypothetical protein [Planctomycetota bacterium]
MSRLNVASVSPRFALVVTAMMWGAMAVAPGGAAAETLYVVRVEEDWELVLGNPDPTVDAPQVTCTISPGADAEGMYAAIELNHRSQPSFAAGGIQLQVWNGESLLNATSFNTNAELATADETVRWTQTMTVSGGNLVFEVVNGASSTWGAFGGQGYLKTIVASPLANLNAYHPDVSVQSSGVGYAGNRVQSLVLREVRWVLSDGAVLTESTDRVVH